MSAVPTFAELERAGADAGAVIDSAEWELERAIPMAANKAARCALADDLKRVQRLREVYFGGDQ